MLYDARNLESDTLLTYDLCIVGGGAAGITLALELEDSGLRICLLESGGEYYEDETQALTQAVLTGDHYPATDISRLRILGGSTNHWEGNCSPLSPIDFEKRNWVENSGWPISYQDIEPYYKKAATYCELTSQQFAKEYWTQKSNSPFFDLELEQTEVGIAQSSPPTNFGERYFVNLQKSSVTDVYLYANVLHIALDDQDTVRHVDVGVIEGSRFRVTARQFILATGGIENARMLLLSDDVQSNGIGNAHDQVGRYFMDHVIVEGAYLLPEPMFEKQHLSVTSEDNGMTPFFQLSEDVMRTLGLANVRMPLIPVTEYYMSSGISSYHHIMEDLAAGSWPNHLGTHIYNVFADLDMVLEATSRRVFDAPLFEYANNIGGFVLDTMVEQYPHRDNRISLSNERDYFGQRRSHLHWMLHDEEKQNLWRCYDVLAAEVGAAGIGRVNMQPENERLFTELLSYGHHHMGTTRMSETATTGVVDRNLKLHSVKNLYVAGSSVFPTGGHVPPTLTIVAMAARLSDHLKTIV